MAVETHNRPAISFHTYGYIVLMHIAWTSLLLACFERKGKKPYYRRRGSIRYVKIDGEPKRWDLSKCMQEYWHDQKNPVTANLEFFIELRNKIEHRHLPELDAQVFGESQALLFNFEDVLEKEFGTKWAVSESLSIPLQFSRLRLPETNSALRYVLRPLPQDIRTFMNSFKTALSDDIRDDMAYSYKVFLIPNVKNNYSKDALAVEFVPYDPSKKEDYRKIVTLIKERQLPVLNVDVLKPSGVVKEVATRLGPARKFNMSSHVRAWQYHRVRPTRGDRDPEKCNKEYCIYDKAHDDYLYTKKWVDFLVNELSDNAKYADVAGLKK